MDRAHSTHGKDGKSINILVGKLEGKRPLRRLGYRWDDIKIDLREMGGKVWTGYIWIRTGTSGRPL
jgi:hypothetical protein